LDRHSYRRERPSDQAKLVPTFRQGAARDSNLSPPIEAAYVSVEKSDREADCRGPGGKIQDERDIGRAPSTWLVDPATKPFLPRRRSVFLSSRPSDANEKFWTGFMNWR